MTEHESLAALVAKVRGKYDALAPGAKATLRRCATADEVRIEGVYWRLIGDAGVPDGRRHAMASVVVCFDAAGVGTQPFAPWLRATVYGDVSPSDLPARAVRFRRALTARDRDELTRELRRLLRHGFQASRRGVDWGSLGTDIVYWGDAVRRRWAETFYTDPKSAA